jgi:hypothetical protein
MSRRGRFQPLLYLREPHKVATAAPLRLQINMRSHGHGEEPVTPLEGACEQGLWPVPWNSSPVGWPVGLLVCPPLLGPLLC